MVNNKEEFVDGDVSGREVTTIYTENLIVELNTRTGILTGHCKLCGESFGKFVGEEYMVIIQKNARKHTCPA